MRFSPDSHLLYRISQRDTQALSELYEQHASTILGFLTEMVSHREKAEHLLEETFFALWETTDDVNGSTRRWLLRQAYQQCVQAGYVISKPRSSSGVVQQKSPPARAFS